MVDALKIKKDDLQPYYNGRATSGDNIAINITGATIYCTMKNRRTKSIKINRQTSGINLDLAASGDFSYRWVSGDTNTVGQYDIEFEINPSSGGKFTFPSAHEQAVVEVVDTLD